VPDTLLTQQEQLTLHVIDGACKWDMVSDEQRLLHSLGKSQGVLFNDDSFLLNGCAGYVPQRPAVAV